MQHPPMFFWSRFLLTCCVERHTGPNFFMYRISTHLSGVGTPLAIAGTAVPEISQGSKAGFHFLASLSASTVVSAFLGLLHQLVTAHLLFGFQNLMDISQRLSLYSLLLSALLFSSSSELYVESPNKTQGGGSRKSRAKCKYVSSLPGGVRKKPVLRPGCCAASAQKPACLSSTYSMTSPRPLENKTKLKSSHTPQKR